MSDNARNGDWTITPDKETGRYSWDQVKAALLMDIRDELRRLNRVFACSNFLAIPSKIDTLCDNTKKTRRRKVRRGK
jgi:hypothetical protein